MTPRPPAHVLAAFELEGPCVPLEGGGGTSHRCGDAVLKPVDDAALATWVQWAGDHVADQVADHAPIIIPRPCRAVDGEFVVDGWIASRHVPGLVPLGDRPDLVIDAGRAFAEMMAGPTSEGRDLIAARADRWAVADRYAWSEEEVAVSPETTAVVEVLRTHTSEHHDDAVVIHGDLTGNVFATADDRLVVLDVSPFLRPVRYGSAIVVADHLLWHDGAADLLSLVDDDHDAVARALIFRLVAEQLAERPRHGAELGHHQRALAALGW